MRHRIKATADGAPKIGSFRGCRRTIANPMLKIAECTRAERLLLGKRSCGSGAADALLKRREQSEIDVHRLERARAGFDRVQVAARNVVQQSPVSGRGRRQPDGLAEALRGGTR